eukprot:CFRG7213T1
MEDGQTTRAALQRKLIKNHIVGFPSTEEASAAFESTSVKTGYSFTVTKYNSNTLNEASTTFTVTVSAQGRADVQHRIIQADMDTSVRESAQNQCLEKSETLSTVIKEEPQLSRKSFPFAAFISFTSIQERLATHHSEK